MRHNRRPIHAVPEQAGSPGCAAGGAPPDDVRDGPITAEMLARAKEYLAAGANATAEQMNDWNAFYHPVSPMIRSYARRYGAKTDADIKDCQQEVSIILFHCLPSFELDPSRGTYEKWLRTIVARKTIDLYRAARRQPACEDPAVLEIVLDPHVSDAEFLVQRETFAVVWAQIESALSKKDMEILRLRIIEERPVEEVAQLLETTSKIVWERLCRARRHAEEIVAKQRQAGQ